MIDTSKEVIFKPDRGVRYDDFKMKDILFENDEICLCYSDVFCDDKIILFNKTNGKVLTENVSFGNYYAKNNIENPVIDNKFTIKDIKEKLIRIGYSGNFLRDDIEAFLVKKYYFNIRNIDCYLNYGGINDYKPAVELIPLGFFSKDYIKNETETEAIERSLNLALDLILTLKMR